jgi:hypothetical protein
MQKLLTARTWLTVYCEHAACGESVGMIVAEHPPLVGEHLFQFANCTCAVSSFASPVGEASSGGEGIAVVIAEHPPFVVEHLFVLGDRARAIHSGAPPMRGVVAHDERVEVIVAEAVGACQIEPVEVTESLDDKTSFSNSAVAGDSNELLTEGVTARTERAVRSRQRSDLWWRRCSAGPGCAWRSAFSYGA